MKLPGSGIQIEFNPLKVSGSILITGGSPVQFFDGNSYLPNREGTPSSPILIEHMVSIIDPDNTGATFSIATDFYEDDTLITAETPGYTLIDGKLRVEKNIPAGTSLTIKARSKFVDHRGTKSRVYERDDTTYLRTLLKSEAPYQLELSTRGAHFFDGHRNPNRKVDLTAILRQNGEELTNYTGITFKWLNSAGKDVEEYELYHDEYINSGRGMVVDLTYIDHEMIRCEAWMYGEMIGYDTVTYIRDFGTLRVNYFIPELPLVPGVETITCYLELFDELGDIDVDAHYLVTWMVVEGTTHRALATGAEAEIPVSAINLKAANLEIYPDVKRREAFAALTTDDPDELLTDDDDNVLVVETFGN